MNKFKEMNTDKYHRMIHDAVHGSFYLHKLLWAIIDTPEFQRLRQIKQCGNTHYVYDCANHTRFEHSIGVAHLCDVFASKLRAELLDHADGDVDILSVMSQKNMLCLQVAGLCHDIGHCAFSHLFDSEVVPFFYPDSEFCHEQASYMILTRLYRGMTELFNHHQIYESDIQFIGKLILGSPEKVPFALRDELVWNEFDFKNQFLFQIVSDETAGIDVDKFDYIKRDCHNTGIITGFDPQRLMEFAYIHINNETGIRELAYLDKSKELISEMWKSRTDLHRRVYQHRVVKCIDEMILEIFKLAGKKFLIGGVALCDIHLNMDAYLQVTDTILTLIKFSPDPELSAAQSLVARLENRELWKTTLVIYTRDQLDANQLKELSSNIAVATAHVAEDWIYYFYQKQLDSGSKSESEPEFEFEFEFESDQSVFRRLIDSLPSSATVRLNINQIRGNSGVSGFRPKAM